MKTFTGLMASRVWRSLSWPPDFCKKSGPQILLQIPYTQILVWIPGRDGSADFCKNLLQRNPAPQILLQILYIQILVWIPGRIAPGQILLQILYDRSVARITGKKGSADLCTKP